MEINLLVLSLVVLNHIKRFLGHYPARALPSAGVFPWVKSLVCDLQNPCFQTEVPSEIPGQINDQATLNTSSIE